MCQIAATFYEDNQAIVAQFDCGLFPSPPLTLLSIYFSEPKEKVWPGGEIAPALISADRLLKTFSYGRVEKAIGGGGGDEEK